jgi:hypothetical protein
LWSQSQRFRFGLNYLQQKRALLTTMPGEIDPIQRALLKEECIQVNENDEIIGSVSKKKCKIYISFSN